MKDPHAEAIAWLEINGERIIGFEVIEPDGRRRPITNIEMWQCIRAARANRQREADSRRILKFLGGENEDE